MRRNTAVFAMLLALGLASGRIAAQEPHVPFLYVGGHRPEIAIFRLDTASGTLVPAGRTANVGQDPSFLAFDPAAKFLFAVNETDPGRVRSFVINRASGAGPRHLDFHPSGRFAYVINELDLTMTAYTYVSVALGWGAHPSFVGVVMLSGS